MGEEFVVGLAEGEHGVGVDGTGGDGGEVDGAGVFGVGGGGLLEVAAWVLRLAVVVRVVAGEDVEFEVFVRAAVGKGGEKSDRAAKGVGGELGAGGEAEGFPLVGVGAGPGEVVSFVFLAVVALPFQSGAAEDAEDGKEEVGGGFEVGVRAGVGDGIAVGGGGFDAGLAPLAEGGEGGAAGAGL